MLGIGGEGAGKGCLYLDLLGPPVPEAPHYQMFPSSYGDQITESGFVIVLGRKGKGHRVRTDVHPLSISQAAESLATVWCVHGVTSLWSEAPTGLPSNKKLVLGLCLSASVDSRAPLPRHHRWLAGWGGTLL